MATRKFSKGIPTRKLLARVKKKTGTWFEACIFLAGGLARATHRFNHKEDEVFYHTGIDDVEHETTSVEFVKMYPTCFWFDIREE